MNQIQNLPGDKSRQPPFFPLKFALTDQGGMESENKMEKPLPAQRQRQRQRGRTESGQYSSSSISSRRAVGNTGESHLTNMFAD